MAFAPTSPARSLPFGRIALALATLAAIPLFWSGAAALGAAWATPEYSHGPLIPLISLFLFLREMRDQPPVVDASPSRSPGLILGLFALLLALAGNRTAIPDIVTYAMILWVMAVVLIVMGWSRGRRHWASVFHLVFMLPLPQVLYWKVSTALQGVSAEIGVALVKAAGIPVLLEGQIIDLGVWQLQVAEACSGLRYLFPILSFSYLTAILYRGPLSHKVILFAMAAPLAILLNAVRIGIIGILVDRYGIAQAEGFLHVFEGWVIFGICIALLLATAWALSRRRVNPDGMLDLDVAGLAPEAARISRIGGGGAMMALAGLTFAAIGLQAALSEAGPVPRSTLAAYPLTLGNWSGQRGYLDPDVVRILGATDYLAADYAAPGQSGAVGLFVAWYARQADGTGLHSPEICLPAAGWEIASLDKTTLQIDGDSFPVNRAIIQNGLSRQMVYYWFEQRGTRLTSDWQAKFSAVRDGLLTGRSDGMMVRFMTPIGADESEADAEARLRALAVDALPPLVPLIPG
ncbi:VPLPA-CTERM-specific exosortase XrtD [Jannaschia pohangensis]|uniref:Exosortase D, VPLPA-CTERM-specific n=1 Tax=Jannaschia pohangensis TaxID=390807 RepID=A0A1I3TSI2_9RHOB|nr:VPLPA-CTERM-specific exosortase XrtD [Jannaschia pohangensis]SFJ73755.1 exosortase D, VPLPA-CTERM-specific [Jannaschia pohangensis]